MAREYLSLINEHSVRVLSWSLSLAGFEFGLELD